MITIGEESSDLLNSSTVKREKYSYASETTVRVWKEQNHIFTNCTLVKVRLEEPRVHRKRRRKT